MQEMRRRWSESNERFLPTIDRVDIPRYENQNVLVKGLEQGEEQPYQLGAERKNRQFAPEYSQSAYLKMLSQELVIGDYFDLIAPNFGINRDTRESMIKLMERLSDIKGYKEDTLFLAIFLADLYLASLVKENRPAPVLVSLGAICVFMAAKLNETPCPSLDLIIDIIRFKQKKPDWR